MFQRGRIAQKFLERLHFFLSLSIAIFHSQNYQLVFPEEMFIPILNNSHFGILHIPGIRKISKHFRKFLFWY